MQTPWVQAILKLAKRVIVAFEREATPETQVKTDAAHQVQMQRLQEVCGAQVTGWKPPEGAKDIAELNVHQGQQIKLEAAERASQAQQEALARQEAVRPARSYPRPGMDR